MSRRSLISTSDLALIAGTVFATLAVQRHFLEEGSPLQKAALASASIGVSPSVAPVRASADPLRVIFSHWKSVLSGTYNRINRDRILATAAGIVFYGLLAIFPGITAVVSSYGLFADPATISEKLQSLAVMLPDGSFAIAQDEIGRILAKPNSSLSLAFVFGLLLAIWSANAGVKALLDALNVAEEVEEKRGLVRLNLVSLAFTVAALVAILVMVGAVIGVPLALKHFGLDQHIQLLVQIGRWPLLAMILFGALMIVYRFGPSRGRGGWRWLTIGAGAAVILWLIGSALLSWYLSNFANYNATYGSLGAAIGLMTWMWMSAIIVLVGAELNSEIERQASVKRLDLNKV